ncbi:hypothetical protein BGZ94_007867 [Podila epigama]|nr:hypothetical protein BGZ94_007867 [Podila epigama]
MQSSQLPRQQGYSLRQYNITHQDIAHPTLNEIPRDYHSSYLAGSRAHPECHGRRRTSCLSEREQAYINQSVADNIEPTEYANESPCANERCESRNCLRWRIASTFTSGLECSSNNNYIHSDRSPNVRMDISRPSSTSVSSEPSSRESTPLRETTTPQTFDRNHSHWHYSDNSNYSQYPLSHHRDSAHSFSSPSAYSASSGAYSTPAYAPDAPSEARSSVNDEIASSESHYYSNMHLIATVATNSEKMSIDRLLNPASPTSVPGYEARSQPASSLQMRLMSEHDHQQCGPSRAVLPQSQQHHYACSTKHSSSQCQFHRRSPDLCEARTTSAQPSPPRQRREKRAWDDKEIQLLLRCVVEAKNGGAKWRRVANLMKNGRSATSCANKYKRMKHKPAIISTTDEEQHSSGRSSPAEETMDEEDESSEGEER